MTTELRIRNIGNSKGVIIPSDILLALGIDTPRKTIRLTVNKEKRTGTISVNDLPSTMETDPFACLSTYTDIWNRDTRSDIEIAEGLKSGRNDIDR